MKSLFLNYRNSKIHYRLSGRGGLLLICFHGFAETADSFDLLEEICGDKYRICAFDLPFHGLTEWKDGQDFSIEDLTNIIKACPEIRDQSYVALGYSMGGRVALSLYEDQAEKIKGLILLAPDGLIVNPWYAFATRTMLGNRIFRSTMRNPDWFFQLLILGDRLGTVNPGISKFVRNQIDNKEMREKIYAVWTAMRSFRPDLAHIKKMIPEYKTPACLIFGKYDRVIRAQSGRNFIRGIEPLVLLSEIEAGHQLLQPEHAETLKGIFDYYFEHQLKSGT